MILLTDHRTGDETRDINNANVILAVSSFCDSVFGGLCRIGAALVQECQRRGSLKNSGEKFLLCADSVESFLLIDQFHFSLSSLHLTF